MNALQFIREATSCIEVNNGEVPTELIHAIEEIRKKKRAKTRLSPEELIQKMINDFLYEDYSL